MRGPWVRARIPAQVLGVFAGATTQPRYSVAPSLVAAEGDALALNDTLEALIDEGSDTAADREFANASLLRAPDGGRLNARSRVPLTVRPRVFLGTLYVIAPASLVSHGNSETGIELLEGPVAEHPEGLESHVPFAEAYLALGDTKPALPHLCRRLVEKKEPRRTDQLLLNQRVASAGMSGCLEGSHAGSREWGW
ncbi:MAG TPA: hypothetical protein VKM54_15095 [Myxococcota bacterium]|nr:hypothetical protein [Myxococcota bacterium]